MSYPNISSPEVHSIIHLYKHIDKLDLTPLLNHSSHYNYPVIKSETLNINFTVSSNKRYLELKHNYLQLYKFKIPLGKETRLLNKRVKNTLLVKLHKVVNKTNIDHVNRYIHFILKKRIMIVILHVHELMNKNIKAKLFNKRKICKLSDYFLSFCDQFNLECFMEIKRSITGKFQIRMQAVYTPFYNFVQTFKLCVRGNNKEIIEKLKCILNKKVLTY